ncbi:histidine utilization repressor [Rhodospirillum rubrum F11]|uniref:Histidine utilization repressor n=1 Tax=Rhodospirillum rubrum (strain ATCC 11170 / ATH 1.1.1 / DSM 467 / LMG 4362 / NCIMB 8255 / S1) TaxID=269796 RepID=Q2RUV0_RHORT|nr:transcriptional regulator, histidine utilization repressor, GntR family [Rhodospirillum rubrum ATCC 11170]AEO47809.1 histidine utilization repressor [Rhodospirillum rubrum F11]MBK5953685.1 histidine utilization repressor [Rhodospirillum rubrum]QXG81748.1 histidine utilization repressor [Rhodospirillum rubrum]HAQ00349.1 histidine utilization repressor [Rhodospirillum rubrum]
MWKSGPVPLYEAVKRDLLRKIDEGLYAPDARLPSENELVAAYGVSRMTVHRALRELSQQGVLVRLQGVGTFVRRPRPQAALMEVRDITEEIRGRGHRHDATLVTLERLGAPPLVAHALDLAEGAPLFHSLIVHREEGVPVQVEERFVLPAFAPDYLEQDFLATVGTSTYLLSRGPISELEHVIQAECPDEATRALLDLGGGEPCLRLVRRTWTGDRPVTYSLLTYPGSRYSLGSRQRLERGRPA